MTDKKIFIAKPPRFVQKGKWEPQSFPGTPENVSNGRTVIRIPTKRGFQHVLELDWADYGHKDDAEALAAFICNAVNR